MDIPEGPASPGTWDPRSYPANTEELLAYAREQLPNVDELIVEDGKPVDNFFAEKQHRLLTEPLYSSWTGPGEGRPFLVMANVGLFNTAKHPPQVPDVMLSLEVQLADDLSVTENRSYLVWIIGKPPEVAIEFVSDRTGGEESFKFKEYGRIGVLYYAIFDPRSLLGHGVLRAFALREGKYEPVETAWLSQAYLGLTLWEGEYEGHRDTWLRWCDQQGQVIPTGRERAEVERTRADTAQQRADRLTAKLRELGHNPDA